MPIKQQDPHIHKFKRHKHKSGNIVFFCTLPDCHAKMNPVFALGKRSICWRCGQPFIMNEYSLRLVKPHCENCHKPKGLVPLENEPVKSAMSLAEKLAALTFTPKQDEDEI